MGDDEQASGRGGPSEAADSGTKSTEQMENTSEARRRPLSLCGLLAAGARAHEHANASPAEQQSAERSIAHRRADTSC